MRISKYIDVDSLRFPNICIFDMTLHGATVPMVRLVDLQKLVPAADVAPVRHGRFLGTEFGKYDDDGNPVFHEWICSECRCVFEGDEPKMNYCPNCGAKMEGVTG